MLEMVHSSLSSDSALAGRSWGGDSRAERRLVLQGGASGEEGVLEVVVEQTADGRHVDVCEAR